MAKLTIDRDEMLDAADDLVVSKGASALTIDALAKAMNISKGGVQYAFTSKDGLVDAILKRWERRYNGMIEDLLQDGSGRHSHTSAHLEMVLNAEPAARARTASLLAAFMQSPDHIASIRQWYHERLANLDMAAPQGRAMAVTFLAVEGASMLRDFKLIDPTDEQWNQITEVLKDQCLKSMES